LHNKTFLFRIEKTETLRDSGAMREALPGHFRGIPGHGNNTLKPPKKIRKKREKPCTQLAESKKKDA
jgi:hypothetical protein